MLDYRTICSFVAAAALLQGCGGRSASLPPVEPPQETGTQLTTLSATPPPSVPLHIHGAMTYYQGENINKDIPASWMAAHYSDTEQGSAGGAYSNNFMNAGGQFAIMYTDGNIAPFCYSPFATANGAKPGKCTGPVGADVTTVKSAWLHDSLGNRLHVTAYGTQVNGQWQERMNPASLAVQTAYHNWTVAMVLGTRVNAFENDDIQTDYEPSYFTYKFGATSKEYNALGTSANAAWFAAQQKLATASVRPVFANGLIGFQESQYLLSANVLGHMQESCATTSTTLPIMGSAWIANMNHLLIATGLHRYAICINYDVAGSSGITERTYAYASWLLTYDPLYSIVFNQIPMADAHETYPEHGLAVFSPLQTATSNNITTLRRTTGAYVREFAFCYVQKVAIGPCAAVVNPDSVAHSIGALSNVYLHYLALNTKSWYAGGTVGWGAFSSAPTTIGAHAALILKK